MAVTSFTPPICPIYRAALASESHNTDDLCVTCVVISITRGYNWTFFHTVQIIFQMALLGNKRACSWDLVQKIRQLINSPLKWEQHVLSLAKMAMCKIELGKPQII
ncbi:hypothetical protein ACJX0J_030576, partial [Zea mays]